MIQERHNFLKQPEDVVFLVNAKNIPIDFCSQEKNYEKNRNAMSSLSNFKSNVDTASQLQKRFFQPINTKMNPYGDGSHRHFKTENWSLNLYLSSFHMIAFTSVLKSESQLVQPRYWSSRASLEENTTFYSESGSYVPLSIFQNQVFPVNVYSLSKILPSKVNLCPVMRVMC